MLKIQDFLAGMLPVNIFQCPDQSQGLVPFQFCSGGTLVREVRWRSSPGQEFIQNMQRSMHQPLHLLNHGRNFQLGANRLHCGSQQRYWMMLMFFWGAFLNLRLILTVRFLLQGTDRLAKTDTATFTTCQWMNVGSGHIYLWNTTNASMKWQPQTMKEEIRTSMYLKGGP